MLDIIFEPVIVVVDGIRSGSFLAVAFASFGIRCLHVRSSPPLPGGSTSLDGPYVECLNYTGDLDELVASLASYRVIAALAGTESGVELTDSLNELLATGQGNGTALSAARRDKYAMRRHADSHAVDQPRYELVRSLGELNRAVESLRTWPLIAKPLRGGGAFGIQVHSNIESLLQHATSLLASNDLFGTPNEGVIVEQCLPGRVVIINSVSFDGKHRVTDMWDCHKTLTDEGSVVFQFMDFMPPSNRNFSRVWAFAENVLDAFQIRFGPAHVEVLLTEDDELFLVEIAARMHGNLDPSMTLRLTGTNQIIETASAFSARYQFSDRSPGEGTPWACRVADFHAPRAGVLVADLDLTSLRALDSFWSARITRTKGQSIVAAGDLLSSPGSVVLAHPDLRVVHADYDRFRAWEAAQFDVALS